MISPFGTVNYLLSWLLTVPSHLLRTTRHKRSELGHKALDGSPGLRHCSVCTERHHDFEMAYLVFTLEWTLVLILLTQENDTALLKQIPCHLARSWMLLWAMRWGQPESPHSLWSARANLKREGLQFLFAYFPFGESSLRKSHGQKVGLFSFSALLDLLVAVFWVSLSFWRSARGLWMCGGEPVSLSLLWPGKTKRRHTSSLFPHC